MDNDKLWKFVSLANAVCSKCGDDNPYLDSDDPNFLCRQCRSRQQAWGGDDKKDQAPTISQTNEETAIKKAEHILTEMVKYLRQVFGSRFVSWTREPDENSLLGREHVKSSWTIDMSGHGELLPTERATIFKTVFAKVLFPALGQEAFIDDTAFGMRVIWNFNGNINTDENATRFVFRPIHNVPSVFHFSVFYPKDHS